MGLRRRVLALSLLAILILGAVVTFLFPLISASDYLESDKLKVFFLSQIERNIGRKIEVGTLDLQVFPSIQLQVEDLVVWDKDPSRTFLKAKRAELVLRLFPLLRGQVVGKRLNVEGLALELRRGSTGHWNFLAEETFGAEPDLAIGNPFRRLAIMREVTVRNGNLAIIDETRPDGTKSLSLHTVDIAVQAQPRRGWANIHLSANLPDAPGDSSLSLAGTFRTTQAQVPVASSNGSIPTFQFDGSVEVTELPLRQIAELLIPTTVPEEIDEAASLRGRIRVVPGVVGYDIVLSDLVAQVDKLAFDGQATLSGLMTAQPTFALTFSSSLIPIHELFGVLPARWIHDDLPRVLEERGIQGNLEVVTATVTGVVTADSHLSLTGELRVQEGHAIIEASGRTARNVSGTVLVEPDRIRAMGLSGMYGSMRVDAGKAMVSFLDAGPWLEVELKGEIETAKLLDEVDISELIPSKQVAKAWRDRRDVQGVTLVDFRIGGPLDKPEEIKYKGAAFEPLDVSFRTSLLPEAVKNLNGRVALSEQGVRFDSLRAWVGQTQVELQGQITGDEKNAFQDFTITTRAEAIELLRLLPTGPPSGPPPIGTLEAVIGLSGRLTAPQFKGRLDLDDTAITIPWIGLKPRGRQAALEFGGAFGKRAVPLVHRLELVLPSLRVTGRGTIRLDKRFRVHAAIGVGPIAVTLLPDWMKPEGLERGDLEISMDVRGKGKDWSRWQLTGWVAVTNGVWSVKGIDSVVRDVNLRLKLVPKGAELKQLTFRILDSSARLSGIIRNWQTKPFMALVLESSHFDIDLLIPKDQRSPVRDFFEHLAATSRVTAKATLKRATYKLLSFTDLSFRLNITNGVVDVDRITGNSLPGNIDGRVVIHLPEKKPASAEAVWRIAEMPFEDIHSLVDDRDPPVNGDVFMTGSLRGDGKNPAGVLASLNGQTDFRIGKGRIFKDDSRAVWKILSMLSLPALLRGQVDLEKDGFPFDQITASMIIENGHVSSENIVVDSPVVKLSAAGTYDATKDELDYVFAVSPFGPYSDAIKSIPLFGKLFDGERRGLATALFDVTGPLEDPKVEYRPMESFASGLGGLAKLAVDLLINLVTLPKKIIAPTEDEKPDLTKMPELSNPPSP